MFLVPLYLARQGTVSRVRNEDGSIRLWLTLRIRPSPPANAWRVCQPHNLSALGSCRGLAEDFIPTPMIWLRWNRIRQEIRDPSGCTDIKAVPPASPLMIGLFFPGEGPNSGRSLGSSLGEGMQRFWAVTHLGGRGVFHDGPAVRRWGD